VGAVLEGGAGDQLGRVVDDHDDRDFRSPRSQAGERRERDLGVRTRRQDEALVCSAAGLLDSLRDGPHRVEADARLGREQLEIEQGEGCFAIGDDECAKGAANGLSRGFLAVRSR
jgi:hypothetical protein